MNLVRAEWIKLRTVRSSIVLLCLAVALGIGLSILVPLILRDSEEGLRGVDDLFPIAVAGLGFAQVLLGVVGVLVMAQEHRYTLRVTFTAEPRRWRVMTAKAVVVLLVTMVVAAVVVAVSLAVGGGILSARGYGLDIDATYWRAVAGAVTSTMLQALIGLGLGALLPSAAAAITLLVVWPMVIESIFVALLPEVGKWLPFQAATEMWATRPYEEGLGTWTAWGYVGVIAVAMWAIGAWAVSVRDA